MADGVEYKISNMEDVPGYSWSVSVGDVDADGVCWTFLGARREIRRIARRRLGWRGYWKARRELP